MHAGDLLAGLIQASPFYLLVAFVAVRSRTLAREGRPVPTGRLCLIAAGVAGFFGVLPLDFMRSALFAITGAVGVMIGLSHRRALVPAS